MNFNVEPKKAAKIGALVLLLTSFLGWKMSKRDFGNYGEVIERGFLEDKSECRKKIYFLKTHKTASSVIENILMRWVVKILRNRHFSTIFVNCANLVWYGLKNIKKKLSNKILRLVWFKNKILARPTLWNSSRGSKINFIQYNNWGVDYTLVVLRIHV